MVRVEGRWAFTCSHQKLLGPRNPHQKPALVAITRSGAIKVLFQSQDNRWQDFKSDIDNFSRPAELLTHAAMCVEKITDGRSSEKGKQTLFSLYAGF